MLTNSQRANQIRNGSTSAELLNFLFLTCGLEFDQICSSRSTISDPIATDRSIWWVLGDLSSMSAVASHRSMLRHTRFITRQTTRRHASTTEAAKDTAANTAAKTKETASNVQTKASQGLSRVTTSAGSGLSRASQGISKAVGRIGGRTGRLISFVECE